MMCVGLVCACVMGVMGVMGVMSDCGWCVHV